MKVFIAGPLFTIGQRFLLEQIDSICNQFGFSTFLPHRDTGLNNRDLELDSTITNRDILELNKCDIVVAVLDGAEADSGTCWEMGYAFANKKYTIGFIDDTRYFNHSKQINPMMFFTIGKLVTSIDELKTELRKL